MGVRDPNIAPNCGTKALVSRASFTHASVTACLPRNMYCPSHPVPDRLGEAAVPDRLMAADLMCGKAYPKPLVPDLEGAVGLRMAKANTKTPSFSLPGSIIFPIEDEPTRLAASTPFSEFLYRKEPFQVFLIWRNPPQLRSLRCLPCLLTAIRLQARYPTYIRLCRFQ